jgi:hypothetical protein
MLSKKAKSHLKNVLWPNIFVGASFQILDIQQYASGLKLGPAAILNQNPIFEMASGVLSQIPFSANRIEALPYKFATEYMRPWGIIPR